MYSKDGRDECWPGREHFKVILQRANHTGVTVGTRWTPKGKKNPVPWHPRNCLSSVTSPLPGSWWEIFAFDYFGLKVNGRKKRKKKEEERKRKINMGWKSRRTNPRERRVGGKVFWWYRSGSSHSLCHVWIAFRLSRGFSGQTGAAPTVPQKRE